MFVVYEHADAVVTAKDIFKDVKLDGRPLRMFDQNEIAKIHSQQEELIAQNRNYNYENNPSQNFSSKSYEGPYHLQDGRTYSNFNRNTPDYRGSERYAEMNRRNLPHNNVTPSNQPEVENNHRDWRANSMRNTSMTSYSSNNSAQSRPDLLPTSSHSPKVRKFDAESTFHDLMNGPNNVIDHLMNPYNMPVSRNSQEVQDRFSNRSSQLDNHEYNADFHGSSMHGRHSRDNQEEFDHYDTRHRQRNKYDSNHSNHYRNHPYREHQPDRESYAQGPKFTNLSPGANYTSRNPYAGERDNKYREQQKHRPRRH